MRTKRTIQTFRAQIAHMAEADLLAMIPETVLSEIKATDEHPEFRAYIIGHEGEARGRMVGKGRVSIQYFKDAIRKLGEKLVRGVRVFQGHQATNAHSGRQVIGEVVASAVQEIKGRLSAIAAVYVRPEARGQVLDVASVEADLTYVEDEGGVRVDTVDEVTGIALGDARTSKPGFPGATLQACLQHFAEEGEGSDKMTKEEITEAIREGKFGPSDLFDENDLKSDRVVKRISNAQGKTDHEHARAAERRLDEERENHATTKKELETASGKLAKVQSKSNELKVGGLFKVEAEARKLDEKQAGFVQGRLAERFQSKATEDQGLAEDLKKHVDSELAEYASLAKMFGVNVETPGNGTDQSRGAPPADGTEQGSAGSLEDPKANDFIPQIAEP